MLALPALERAAGLWPVRPLVQLPAGLAPLLGLAGAEVEVLPLRNRHRLIRASRELRRRRPDVGVLLTPSFSAALLFLLAGVRERRGTDTDARGWLLTDRVDRDPLLRGHRVREYLALVDGSGGDGSWPTPDAGAASDGGSAAPGRERIPRPRLRVTREASRAWEEAAADAGVPWGGDTLVGLVPGGRAASRRWPPGRWRELAGRLDDMGLRTAVFGGREERELTAEVVGDRSGVHDLGGRTGLLALAGGLEACDVVVANDTGPMHVAAALDRPLLVVWGAGDPRQTRPLGDRVRLVGSFDLPCHPCLRNECPRSGTGYRLETARRECLRLVEVHRVAGELEDLLDRAGGAGARGPEGERPVESGSAREGET